MKAYATCAVLVIVCAAASAMHVADSRCPQYPVVTAVGGGRTANCIWEYVVPLMAAKYLPREHQPYTQRFVLEVISNVFEGLSLPAVEDIPKACKYANGVDWYEPNFYDIFTMIPLANVAENFKNYTKNMVIQKCQTFVEPVYKHIKEIKQEMRYKKEFVDNAVETINRLRQYFITIQNLGTEEKTTIVGVHVRRTDYISYLQKYENRSSIGAEYFKTAFQYFRDHENNFGRPIFLVVSDDQEWVENNLITDDVYLVSKGGVENPGYDLAMLSLCDHSIIDYGTYGLWAALYTEGEVISVLYRGTQVNVVLGNAPNWHFVDTSKEVLEIF